MLIVGLEPHEIEQCKSVITKYKKIYASADDEKFIRRSSVYATELPERIRIQYKTLKYCHQSEGMLVVRGYPVEYPGPTPESWDYEQSYKPNLDIDYLAVLLSTIVGDVFAWETQQKGKLIHDLIPIKGKGQSQTGYGSDVELLLHTEDSFHQLRGDYVSFYAVRNDDEIATTFASVANFSLSNDVKKVLFQKRFSIKPDESHLDNSQLSEGATSAHYISDLCDDRHKIALLYGNFDHPFLCFDPFYTGEVVDDPEAKEALDQLCIEVKKHTFKYSLRAGDICVVDNRRVVHGRGAFNAKFDGTDRWLKRINITADLRKSASARPTLSSRVVGEPKLR
jgi:Fe(II)/alpha-ketoglutarate-dependent arginine beta-hydroxylase